MKKFLILLLLPTVIFAQTKVRKYEYWFDNDYAGRVTTNITPVVNFTLNTSISAAALPVGLHVIHIRFQDDNAKWSATASQFFQKIPASSVSVNLVGYEFWFDNDYSGRVYTALTPQQNVSLASVVSASALPEGIHVIHIHFRDNTGKWSSTLSQFFHKTLNGSSVTRNITAYEYWFDNGYASASLVNVGPSQSVNLIAPLSATPLADGIHILHVRFRDDSGFWSGVVSQFFHKSAPSTITTVQLVRYQYWYDNDFANVTTTTVTASQDMTLITPLSTTSLTDGLHILHLRFADNNGKWSSVISQFFRKPAMSMTAVNKIVAYRYWFDTGDSAMVTSAVPPVHDLDLNTTISLVSVPHGIRMVHFQFRDSLGKWSAVMSDSVLKLAVPIALFSASDTVFCDSGSVAFSNFSIDGDIYLWDFGDATSSTLGAPVHQYTTPGLYTVSLTATDTSSGRDSTTTFTTYIEVYATPVGTLTVSPNDSICAGSTATMAAPVNYLYSWNTGATSSFITAGVIGDYFATLSNTQYAGCSRNTDTIHLTVMPLPAVDLGSDTNICQGGQLILDAVNNGATYNWSTGSNASSIVVSSANTYWVSVTSSFGCQENDTITVGIDPLPLSAFTFSVSNMTATFTNGSSSALTYDWDFGDAVHSSQAAPTHTYAGAGTYTVTLIAFNACGSDTTTQVITITGMEQYSSGDPLLNVYPNPAVEIVNIRFATSLDGMVSVEMLDLAGRSVLPVIEQEARGGFVNTLQMPVEILPDGSYLVVMNVEGQRFTRKVSVTH